MDVSGIPRGFDLLGMRRELDALRREVERQTSARTYVSVGNIVEGGTIDRGVGRQLTETVQKDIVVERENIADDALDDRVVTGSTVQTSREPEVGVKMQDDGVIAHGRADVTYPDGNSRSHKVRARLSTQPNRWSIGAEDDQPGFWVESEPADGSAPAPRWPAGFTASDKDARALIGASAADTELEPFSTIMFGPEGVALDAYGAGSETDSHRLQSRGGVTPTGFVWGTYDLGGEAVAEVRHLGDGVLSFYGKNGVLINGEPPTGGGTVPPVTEPSTLVSLVGGFQHFTEAGWSGVRWSRYGNVVEITGAYTKASYGTQEVVGLLPIGIVPKAKKKGTNVEISSSGEVLTTISGTGPQSLGIIYLI